MQQRLGVFANQFVRSHRRRGALSEVAIVDGVPNSNLLSLVGWLPGWSKERLAVGSSVKNCMIGPVSRKPKSVTGIIALVGGEEKGKMASQITIRIKAQ